MDNDCSKNSQNIVEYLLQENRQLKDEISDLKELIKMNKIEIDVLSKANSNKKYIDIIVNYRVAV